MTEGPPERRPWPPLEFVDVDMSEPAHKNPEYVRAAKQRQGQARRDQMHANGPVENIDHEEIGDRDGWVCGLCQDPIDASYRYPDPRSPSLDHIRSVAGGGTETRDNVQIAHWACNHERNADDEITTVEEAEAIRELLASISPAIAEDVATLDPHEMIRESQEKHAPSAYRRALARRIAKWEAK